MKFILPTLLAAALLAPATASAETVAPDPAARQVTALGGTIVWASGQSPARLMQRAADGTVTQIAAGAAAYRDPDLGRDRQGRLVLTYARCSALTRCTYVRDDLAGKVAAFKLAPKRCALSTTPAVWRSRIAYGLGCFKRVRGRRVSDEARSGLYVRNGTAAPKRLPTPKNARRAGATSVEDVDLRLTTVAAIYADIWEYAVVQRTSGKARTSVVAAVSEGEGDQSADGLTIGTGDTRMWWLRTGSHSSDPAYSIIERLGRNCSGRQLIEAPEGPYRFNDHPYVDMSVDGEVVHAVDPGVGIVRHEYKPTFGC